ncbi:unnamed protein product [Cochlearia groenlandica]
MPHELPVYLLPMLDDQRPPCARHKLVYARHTLAYARHMLAYAQHTLAHAHHMLKAMTYLCRTYASTRQHTPILIVRHLLLVRGCEHILPPLVLQVSDGGITCGFRSTLAPPCQLLHIDIDML